MAKERFIDRILKKEFKVFKFSVSVVELLYIVIITLLGLYARKQFIRVESGDWDIYFSLWMDKIKEYGGWKSLGYGFSDYPCMYMYIMVLVYYLPIDAMVGLKCVSIIFDYAMAMAVLLVVYELTKDKMKAIVAFTVATMIPTVMLNSSAMSQCDSIYMTFVLLSLLFALRNNSRVSLIWFGVAFSFKLQAIFFMPVLIILWLERRIKFLHFLWIPIVFVVSCIPACLCGRAFFSDILMIYAGQTTSHGTLTLNYPNIYSITGETQINSKVSTAGICVAIMCLGIIAYAIYTYVKEFNNHFVITVALLCAMLMVYLLPHMHERYGYMAEIFALIYGFCNIKKIYVFILVELCAFCVYVHSCFERNTFPMNYMSIVLGAMIIVVIYDLIRMIKQERLGTKNA